MRTTGTFHQREFEERIHLTIKISHGFPLFLYFKERWMTTTNSRLPISQPMDSQECTSLIFDLRHYGQNQGFWSQILHQIRHMMGIQQCPNQRWRPMESSLQNQYRTIRTNGYVLWIMQFAGHISSYDEWHPQRRTQWRMGHCLYGRHPDLLKNQSILEKVIRFFFAVLFQFRWQRKYMFLTGPFDDSLLWWSLLLNCHWCATLPWPYH